MTRIGSLCSGYGGLDMGVQAVLGGSLAWVSDIDKGSCKLLAHRHPDIPNLGDFTRTDWSTVEPVDVLTAGFPCQPVSHAGKRLGDDDERWLWDDVARAVGDLRPGLVVLENVRGLLSAGGGRLFGRVLGALAELGYDAQWCGLRAADVGAPHGRWRIFIAATDTCGVRRGTGRTSGPGEASGGWASGDLAGRGLLPTPRATRGGSNTETVSLLPTTTARDPKGHNQRRDDSCLTGALLPTPRAGDGEKGGPNQRGSSGDLMLPSAVVNALLPTPNAGSGGQTSRSGDRISEPLIGGIVRDNLWGQYAAAIARWEHITRPAPPPTETGPKGNPRLSAAFSEWLMGLPAGWITDVPGITRNEALKLAGNGVVPQQAEAALRFLLDAAEVAA